MMDSLASKNRFWQSLAFQIGIIIIVAEVLILSITGVIYSRNFNTNVDRRVEQNILLPATLLNDGVLDLNAIANADQMKQLVGSDLSNALIIGTNGNIFFSLNPEYIGIQIDTLNFADADLIRSASLLEPQISYGKSTLSDDLTEHVSSLVPLLSTDNRTIRFYVYVEISKASGDAEKTANTRLFLAGSGATIFITSAILFVAFQILIFRPLQKTNQVVRQIELGDLTARIVLSGRDNEISVLQKGFNSMVEQLEEQVNTLEVRVLQQTRDLRVSGQISRQITTVLSQEALLSELVELTTDAFNLDQTSVFIFDSASQTLQLSAASGQVGEKMLSASKLFHLQENGLVPAAAVRREVIIINDVKNDPRHQVNPLLPNTRSEAVIPIIFGEDLIGVLDLQSNSLNRFSDSDKLLFISFANQIAVAIHNARLFEELELARRQAEQADRAKSAFLASTSHELRTPLNAIINLSSFVKDGLMGPTTERQVEVITLVMQSGQSLLALINDVLDMSKIESGSLKLHIEPNVNIKPIIQDAEQTAISLLKDKKVSLKSDIPETLPLLSVDKHRLQQILLNILSNACKFTMQGEIRLKVSTLAEEVMFQISDTGAGIAPNDSSKVFEKFSQTESGLRQGGGTGLGMPITKNLVEGHGGRIWFESEWQVGTSFYFTIPLKYPGGVG